VNLTTQQKNDYIHAMEIEPWFPRVQLANSQPVVEFVNPKDTLQKTEESTAVESAEAPIGQTALNSTGREKQQSLETSKALEGNTSSNADQPIKFGLGLYIYGDWLISSSLSSNYLSLQKLANQLTINILRTLGENQSELTYHHVISWPFFSNPNSSQGKSAAKQYVNGVIEHLVEEHKVKNLLVFGGVLPKLNDWFEAEGENFGINRIVIPSVYRMLDDPLEKQKAWALMRASSLLNL
jgi:hypothetical protein